MKNGADFLLQNGASSRKDKERLFFEISENLCNLWLKNV